jgi:hypothetical protein
MTQILVSFVVLLIEVKNLENNVDILNYAAKQMVRTHLAVQCSRGHAF